MQDYVQIQKNGGGGGGGMTESWRFPHRGFVKMQANAKNIKSAQSHYSIQNPTACARLQKSNFEEAVSIEKETTCPMGAETSQPIDPRTEPGTVSSFPAVSLLDIAKSGTLDDAQAALVAGAPVTEADAAGCTPLHLAAFYRSVLPHYFVFRTTGFK